MKKKAKSNQRLIELLLSYNTNPASINRLMEVGKILLVKKRTTIIEVGQVCDKGFLCLRAALYQGCTTKTPKKAGPKISFWRILIPSCLAKTVILQVKKQIPTCLP